MARRQVFQLRMFVVLAILSLVIALKPVPITARAEKQIDLETKGQKLNQVNHLRRNENDPKIRTRTRRLMMNVEEINDYPGSGANNRHTRPYCPDC